MTRAEKIADRPIDSILDEADQAFEEGRAKDALALAERAVRVSPRDPAALHYRAAALAEMDDVDAAHAAYQAALEARKDDPETLLGFADFLICRLGEDRDHLEQGLALVQRGLKRCKDPELALEMATLEVMGLNQLGRSQEALARVEKLLAGHSDEVELLLEKAVAQYELCRFQDARRTVEKLLRKEPDSGWGHHQLGLLLERDGDLKGAEKQFALSKKLAPHEFPRPIQLDAHEFDAAVEAALMELPAKVRGYLANVAIAVEDLPTLDDLEASDPPLSPSILGVFRGRPLGEQETFDPWSHFPSSIVLYQKNLERFAKSREELVEQIGITLIHEVGHFLGLEEEELWERGLE